MRTSDGLLVLHPDEGDVFPSLDAVVKARAADTGGRFGVVIVSGEPGEGGRTHVHRDEPEAFFIVEGSVEFLGASESVVLEPGAFVLVPPDTEHGLRVVGDSTARWLAIWPRALDGFPEAREALGENPGSGAVVELRERHGILEGTRRPS